MCLNQTNLGLKGGTVKVLVKVNLSSLNQTNLGLKGIVTAVAKPTSLMSLKSD